LISLSFSSRGLVLRKNEHTPAVAARIVKTSIGHGLGISANYGARMVAILATMLHIPKAVEQ